MNAQERDHSTPRWQAALDAAFTRRLCRPLVQGGVINTRWGRARMARAQRMTNRGSLLDTLRQRHGEAQVAWAGQSAIVYAEPRVSDPSSDAGAVSSPVSPIPQVSVTYPVVVQPEVVHVVETVRSPAESVERDAKRDARDRDFTLPLPVRSIDSATGVLRTGSIEPVVELHARPTADARVARTGSIEPAVELHARPTVDVGASPHDGVAGAVPLVTARPQQTPGEIEIPLVVTAPMSRQTVSGAQGLGQSVIRGEDTVHQATQRSSVEPDEVAALPVVNVLPRSAPAEALSPWMRIPPPLLPAVQGQSSSHPVVSERPGHQGMVEVGPLPLAPVAAPVGQGQVETPTAGAVSDGMGNGTGLPSRTPASSVNRSAVRPQVNPAHGDPPIDLDRLVQHVQETIDLDDLVQKVQRQLRRRLAVERERRGLGQWA